MNFLTRIGFLPSLLVALVVVTVAATACQADILTPPRLATATAQALATPTATLEPLILRSDTPETAVSPTPATTTTLPTQRPALNVWVPETSAEHRQMLQTLASDFGSAHGVTVEMVMVAPASLPKLVNTAVLSGTLPDVIIHPVSYTLGWQERGILDGEAATIALDQLEVDTFDPAALELVSSNGQVAALPSDGFKQLIIYRQDWFEDNDLTVPNTYNGLLTAATKLTNRTALISGFVVPTESNLVSTHQIFEHIALANGCELIDMEGEVQILQPACQEALNFYFEIISENSPLGVQTDTSTRNAYLSGRTGLIMASPTLLPILANSRDCPECASQPNFLAQNSDFVTVLAGSAETSASFSELTYLGITSVAEQETAVSFATYWFNEGYGPWLAVEPERKVPLRWGTASDQRLFIDSWGTQPLANSNQTLETRYGSETVALLRDNVASSPRWGHQQGQGALITELYESLTLSTVLQEMLSGYFNPDKTLRQIYTRVTDLIPNYQFYPEPTPES